MRSCRFQESAGTGRCRVGSLATLNRIFSCVHCELLEDICDRASEFSLPAQKCVAVSETPDFQRPSFVLECTEQLQVRTGN
ncbi:hypothetical protein MTO96_002554 [Rhipicephalus appendiculatus]